MQMMRTITICKITFLVELSFCHVILCNFSYSLSPRSTHSVVVDSWALVFTYHMITLILVHFHFLGIFEQQFWSIHHVVLVTDWHSFSHISMRRMHHRLSSSSPAPPSSIMHSELFTHSDAYRSIHKWIGNFENEEWKNNIFSTRITPKQTQTSSHRHIYCRTLPSVIECKYLICHLANAHTNPFVTPNAKDAKQY